MFNHKIKSSFGSSIIEASFVFDIGNGVEITLTANDLKSFKHERFKNINFDEWRNLVHKVVQPYISASLKYEVEKTLIQSYSHLMYYSDAIEFYSSLTTDKDEDQEGLNEIHSSILTKYKNMLHNLKQNAFITNPQAFRNIDGNHGTWCILNKELVQEKDNFKIIITKSQKDELFSFIVDYFEREFHATSKKEDQNKSDETKIYTLEFLETDGLKAVEEFCEYSPTPESLKELISFFIKDAEFFDFFGSL